MHCTFLLTVMCASLRTLLAKKSYWLFYRWLVLFNVFSAKLFLQDILVCFNVLLTLPGQRVHLSYSSSLSLVLAAEKAFTFQRVQQRIQSSMSEFDAEPFLRLFLYHVTPHWLRLNKSQYLDVKKVSGDALYKSLFIGFCQLVHGLFMSNSVLVHVSAY